jgi:hypothetical protein
LGDHARIGKCSEEVAQPAAFGCIVTISQLTGFIGGGFVRQQQYEVDSLGPIILEIEKRQEKLQAIRPRVAKQERKSLDLRMDALEKSRRILAGACKNAPKMNAYFPAAESAESKGRAEVKLRDTRS